MIDVTVGEVFLSALAWVCFGAWRALPLLLIVAVFDLLFSRRIAARYHCLLWVVVAVGMMCPFSVESSFSMHGRIEPLLQSIIFRNESAASDTTSDYLTNHRAVTPYDTFTFEDLDGQPRTMRMLSLPKNATNAQRAEAESLAVSEAKRIREQPASTDPDISSAYAEGSTMDTGLLVTLAIVGAWFAVALGLIVKGAIQTFCFGIKLGRSETVTDQNVIDQVLRVCDALRVGRRPRLTEVNGLDAPAVFGVWRPTVCLPVDFTKQVSREELRLVLLHEIAHVKRRDGLVLSMAMVMRALHWFNPLAWLVVSRIRVYMEQAADDVALRSASEQTLCDYGRLLLRFASEDRSVRGSAALGLLFASPGKTLARRITVLEHNRSRNHWLAQAFAVGTVLLLAVSGLTDAKAVAVDPLGGVVVPQYAFASRLPQAMGQPNPPVTTITYNVTEALLKIRQTEPGANPERRLLSQFSPKTASLDDGVLTVTDSESMQKQVQQAIAAMERSGYWQTSYRIQIGVADIQSTTSGILEWTVDAVLPLRKDNRHGGFPITTTFSESDHLPREQLSIEFHESKAPWRPLLGVKITQDQAAKFIKRCRLDPRTSILQGPPVTLANGRTGYMLDESQRPFVTGLRPIVEDGAVALQPIIDVLPEGARLMFRGVVTEDELLSIQLRLTLSDVSDVSLAQLPFHVPGDAAMNATVQVPMASSIAATATAKLKQNESLLMVAPMPFNAEQTQQGSLAIFYLVTPKWERGENGRNE